MGFSVQVKRTLVGSSGTLITSATLNVIKDRYLIVTPFCIPLSRFVEFDMALLTTKISKVGSWQVRAFRWKTSSAVEMYHAVCEQCSNFVKICDEHKVLAQIDITSDRVRIDWPRWNQVAGIGEWRDDRDMVVAMLEMHAGLLAQFS